MDEIDGGIEHAAPIWAVFGDLMSGLLGAFVLSLTYIPAVAALALGKKSALQPSFSDHLMGRVERFFQNALSRVLQFPKIAIATAVTAFALAPKE